jgi:dTDP-3-amino-3,4,6-trideoxy-alpha-D-glucose transaminase
VASGEILQNDFQRQWQVVAPAVLAAVERVGTSGQYILGREVEAFERSLAQLCGNADAVGVGNGMDAIEIGLRCLNLRPGDKVLTTPLSAFATTLAVLRAGGVPVFVDVDSCGAIDLEQCRQVLERDQSVAVLLPVHLYGLPLSLRKLQALKNEFELSVVEDCAQAIGASRDGISVGTVGQVAATSFYPTKNLGALGDGGAVLTSDGDIARRAKLLRNYGQSSLYSHDERGLNSRLDELQAAILRDALPHLANWTVARRTTAHAYLTGIKNPAITLLAPEEGSHATWHLFPVLVAAADRENFRAHLRAARISTGVHYPRLIPDQRALADVAGIEVLFEPVNARRFANGEVSLPIHPFLAAEEVDAVIEACNAWRR